MSGAAYLTGPRPDGQPGEWRLDKDEFFIGREAPADLVAPLPRLSRQHARIVCSASDAVNRGYFITDLHSRNGTFVNGEPLGPEARRLKDGDEIVLGGVIAFRFHDPAETVEGQRLGRLVGVWIDETAREVWVDGRRVEPPLSAAQFALLALLYRLAGQVVSRSQIIAAVWPGVEPSGVSGEAVDGLIKRLRARLRETQPAREHIEVLRGHGVRLVQPEG
jgi:hypothetical protein